MKINASNKYLPGVQTETTLTLGNEITREDVFAGGVYVGQVVYVARKRKVGTEYGWRAAKADPRVALASKTDAIRSVLARRMTA